MVFNNIDLVLLGILILSAVIAWFRGFVREVLSLLGWFLASAFALYALPYARPIASQYFTGGIVDIAASLGLYVVFLIFWWFVSFFVARNVRHSYLSGFDRFLGFIFGFLRGGVLITLVALLMNIAVPPEFKSPELQKSKVFPVFETIATTVEPMIPQSILDGITGKKEQSSEDNVKDLVKSLSAPQTTEGMGSLKQGYDSQSTDAMDRLFENAQ